VLAENRGIPDGIVHVQPNNPAAQQMVVELLQQQALAANGVEHWQPQCPQPLLRCHRRAACIRVSRVERARQLRQHPIDHGPNGAQRVFCWHTLFRRETAEQGGSPGIISTHDIVLCVMDTQGFATVSPRLDLPWNRNCRFSAAC